MTQHNIKSKRHKKIFQNFLKIYIHFVSICAFVILVSRKIPRYTSEMILRPEDMVQYSLHLYKQYVPAFLLTYIKIVSTK